MIRKGVSITAKLLRSNFPARILFNMLIFMVTLASNTEATAQHLPGCFAVTCYQATDFE
jgi:hypothetical protein